MQTLHFIDSHTGGEPTRVITSGFPDLGNGSMAERRERFRADFDDWRAGIVLEPRGGDEKVGALLLEPCDSEAVAGVIFFNNVGYLGMCGHGTIGVVHTLHHMGRLGTGRHKLETPVGTVTVERLADSRVTVDNVESHRHARAVPVDVPGYGKVTGDVAWGGNWFFITHDHPCPVDATHLDELTAYTEAVRSALERAGITGAEGGVIDHIEVSGSADPALADSRNFVMCPGMAYDRSPCGTGTSANVACLAAEGILAPGQVWRQAGVLGTVFEASYQPGSHGILPRITGQAWVTAEGELVFDPGDPLRWGIVK